MSSPTSGGHGRHQGDATLPYQETSERHYEAAPFTVETVDLHLLMLRGQCPRCGAEIEIPVIDTMLSGSRTSLPFHAAQVPAERRWEAVLCTSPAYHPGRPEGAVGCGAYWMVEIPAGTAS
ncbi:MULTISPECIES: hypothetical protein [Streptomyces]|uniref:hypothetical protein n=1 Tax=Streptomyces TaxID=1883 RepID=UPI0029B7D0E9|nr:hypothetical protein [Streptomyces europaeiscabiei]MDX3583385.1 hypothetical protein [Streptomyces europaeiscabiei]